MSGLQFIRPQSTGLSGSEEMLESYYSVDSLFYGIMAVTVVVSEVLYFSTSISLNYVTFLQTFITKMNFSTQNFNFVRLLVPFRRRRTVGRK